MEAGSPVNFEPQPSRARQSAEGTPLGVSIANQMTRIYTTKHRGRCAVDCRKAAWRVRRVGTSESNKAEALGQAKLALRFQIPSQASLHGIVKSYRSLASRAALLFASCAR